jgi:hypothetical protein
MDWASLINPIIIAAVPTAVWALKRVNPHTWTYPLIAGALGVAADAIAAVLLNLKDLDPALGAILGLAGVGAREIVNQLLAAVPGEDA